MAPFISHVASAFNDSSNWPTANVGHCSAHGQPEIPGVHEAKQTIFPSSSYMFTCLNEGLFRDPFPRQQKLYRNVWVYYVTVFLFILFYFIYEVLK